MVGPLWCHVAEDVTHTVLEQTSFDICQLKLLSSEGLMRPQLFPELFGLEHWDAGHLEALAHALEEQRNRKFRPAYTRGPPGHPLDLYTKYFLTARSSQLSSALKQIATAIDDNFIDLNKLFVLF